MRSCLKCNDTGVYETGNNDLPCDCPAGDTALFNRAEIIGPVTGAEIKRHFLNGSPEALHIGREPMRAEDLPSRRCKDPIELGDQEANHVSAALLLDDEGRRLAEAAVDHPLAMDLRSAILQALTCLDRGVELSCSACSDLNRFVQLHRNGSPDGSLDDCVRGLNWLLLRLSARDAVRSPSVARWVRYIREHSTDARVLELGDALDAGLRAYATGERLDGQYRDVLVGWLTEPGAQREPTYEGAVQQILRQ